MPNYRKNLKIISLPYVYIYICTMAMTIKLKTSIGALSIWLCFVT